MRPWLSPTIWPIGPPHGEDAVLVAVQSALAGRPGVLPRRAAMSHFGEHSLGWLALSAARRAVPQPQRRRHWLVAGVGAFAAHAAAVLIKRVVRRTRPNHPAVAVNVGTPSQLSFPSAHATSTTAAAVLLGRAAGLRGLTLPAVLVPPMALSRLVLGVHYPSDVLAGVAVGAAVAAVLTEPTWDDVERDERRLDDVEPARRRTWSPAIVKAMRPRQWVKNVLVLAAPLAARRRRPLRLRRRGAARSLIAFVVFCLAASAIYLVNDAQRRRGRPGAPDQAVPADRRRGGAGRAGLRAGGACWGWRRWASSWWLTPNLALVMAVYIAIQLAYCFGLKHQAVLDICIVSSGFLLRAIAGGVAAEHPAVAVVPAGDGVRLAVHGGRQALRRTAARRADRRQDPQVAGELHQHLPAVRLDAVGHRDGGLLRPVGVRARQRHRAPGSRCRWFRSPSRSCATRSTSTAAWPGSPRTSCVRDRVLQLLALAWIGTIGVAVAFG